MSISLSVVCPSKTFSPTDSKRKLTNCMDFHSKGHRLMVLLYTLSAQSSLSIFAQMYLCKCEDTYFILQNKYLCIYEDSFGVKIHRNDCAQKI